MANEELITLDSDDWVAFAQPGGPNTAVTYLRCHDVGDISETLGELKLKFRPDPNTPKRYLKTGIVRGEPGLAEVEITASVRKTRDILEEYLKCGGPLYFHDVCGKKQIFEEWDSQAIILDYAIPTEQTASNIAKKVPGDNDESMNAYSFGSPNKYWPYKPKASRLTGITETAALNGIDNCSTQRCAGYCGGGIDLGQDLVVAGDADAASPADVAIPWDTADAGVTFTEESTAPFGAGEDIAAIICLDLGGGTKRRIAFNGTSQVGVPAESAYSDDGGVTWTSVSIGSTSAQYVLSGKAVTYLDDGSVIWVVTTGGYVYKSTNKGVSYTTLHAGTLTTQNLFSISRYGQNLLVASGAADASIKSTDGGRSWSAMSATGGGGTLNRMYAVTKLRYFVGDSAGNLYFTEDGGTTWSLRQAYGGSIADVVFTTELFGIMLHNSADPIGTVYYTRNGGYSWLGLNTDPNEGLNMILMLSPDEAVVVGEPITGGYAVILLVAPDPSIG